ncbi:DUF5071 domain-containing protein [Rhodobacterales bacterium]|nr:DUF5071 domain-containing protein [Rhodobacterales bacterium]
MTLDDCVPKNKFDLAAVSKAREVGFPGINSVLPDLLDWVQDANWPVAADVADLLSNSGKEIVPHIGSIFSTDDREWKFWTIELIVKRLAPAVRKALWADLRQLVREPTPEDKSCDVDLVAEEALSL